MTVGELKQLLAKYDDDERVEIFVQDEANYEVHNVVEYFDGQGDVVYLEAYP